jgi:hypothetical protein
MEKAVPSERFRHELDEVLAGVAGEEDPIETVGRRGARLILQQALEDEITGSSPAAATSGPGRRSVTATAMSQGR